MYPVASHGAAEQLEHVKLEDRLAVLYCIISKFGLEDSGMNAVEGMHCKTSET
jgi:hypothetical protein